VEAADPAARVFAIGSATFPCTEVSLCALSGHPSTVVGEARQGAPTGFLRQSTGFGGQEPAARRANDRPPSVAEHGSSDNGRDRDVENTEDENASCQNIVYLQHSTGTCV
jgi:hypothetical protein